MVTKTGNKYTTGTRTDSVEILRARPGFSTMANPNKVSPSDCDNDRQPEMAMWPPKPKILLGNYDRSDDNSNGKSGFSITPSLTKLTRDDCDNDRQRPTTGNSNIEVLLANLATSGS